MVCANSGSPNTLYLNDGSSLGETPAWASERAESTTTVALGDIDGDGDLDLVCGNWGAEGRNTLYLNEGGTFGLLPTWESDPTNATLALALGDVDNDGDLDLVCGNGHVLEGGESNTLYLNDGSTFEQTPAWSSSSENPTRGLALGDVDGDGDIDLVCANWRPIPDGEVNTLYLNTGGTFSVSPDWSSTPTNRTRVVQLGDIDGDGRLDLACANVDQVNTIYRNQGGTFSSLPDWMSADSSDTRAMALGDIDADGDLDLACGNWNQPDVLHRNDGGALAVVLKPLPAFYSTMLL